MDYGLLWDVHPRQGEGVEQQELGQERQGAQGALHRQPSRGNDAQLVDVDFGAVRLDEANLERADLTRANLKAADLSAASLSGAVLTDANWWRAVGLTPETIERLVNEFPPSPNAASERVEDYKRWQSERAGGNGR